MYLGAEDFIPGYGHNPNAKKETSKGWTGDDYAKVITPISNVIGNIFGTPAGQRPPSDTSSESAVNWPIIAVAGLGVVALGAVILTKKKRRR